MRITLAVALALGTLMSVGCSRPEAGKTPPGEQPQAARPACPEAGSTKRPAILELARPSGGEWFGLYVMEKKAGYAFAQISEGEYEGCKAVIARNDVTLKVAVGGVQAERALREERVYEYRDGGRLLAFRLERKGDGGDETMLGRSTPEGVVLTRKRPGLPDEQRRLAATAEVVELADAPRVVAARRSRLEGRTLDLEDSLTDKTTSTEPDGEGHLVAAGVDVPVIRTRTLEERMSIPTSTSLAADGRVLEIRLGDVLARAEDAETARQLDKVDLFSLTRVVLDAPIPPQGRLLPAEVVYRVRGLPPELRRGSPRQTFVDEPDGSVKLSIAARYPVKRPRRPVAAKDDAEVAEALQPTLAVESDAPAIVATAAKVVGDETDAWNAVQRINTFVNGHLEKAYGASSDRATGVLVARKGDCTEHALLMTALARAAGIPARRVDGLVYMDAGDGVPALYWHEWVEVYVGEWIAVDPTFNQPVADATHIALGQEARGDTAGLIGQIKVSVLGAKALPGMPPRK